MIHCGTSGEEWKKLHERLRRILWMSDREITEETGFEDYGAVFVDEAHLLSEEAPEADHTGSRNTSGYLFQ